MLEKSHFHENFLGKQYFLFKFFICLLHACKNITLKKNMLIA